MNNLIVNGHSLSIPASWEECPTQAAIQILDLKSRALPPALFRLSVLLVFLGENGPNWKIRARLWTYRLFPALRPKAGSRAWFFWMVMARLTPAQVDEFLLLVAWAEEEIRFQSEKGMLRAPDLPIYADNIGYWLPGDGLVNLSWAQMMEAEAAFRRFAAEPSRARAIDTLSHLYMKGIREYDPDAPRKIRPILEGWSEARINLVLAWFSQCWLYLEECHPLTHEGNEEGDGGDGYGLLGLTHRLAANASDVQNVERMTAWQLLDHLEIKLADAKKHKHDTSTAA